MSLAVSATATLSKSEMSSTPSCGSTGQPHLQAGQGATAKGSTTAAGGQDSKAQWFLLATAAQRWLAS